MSITKITRFYVALTAGMLVAGCNQQPPQQQAPAVATPTASALPLATKARPLIAPADTAFPYTILEHRPTPASSQVLIDGVRYRVEANAVPDSTRPLKYTYPAETKAPPLDSTDTRTASGTEVVYTFRVVKPNGQPLFARQLLKSSFAAEIGQDLATEATPWPPVFLGHLPLFHALAFELTLNPPDSDSGGSLLLLLDERTGRVRQQLLSSWNSGCNSPVALAENGLALLTSFDIIQANGRVTNLERPGFTIAGTLFVNNKTVLIDYLPEQDDAKSSAPRPTARLYDLNGRPLATFNLESLDGGLGYHMQSTYVGQTRTYYLFDENHQQLGLLPHDQPTAMRIINLQQLVPFQAPQHSTEVRFSIDTEGGTRGRFYIDTVSQKVRYRLLKPTY